MEPTPIISRKPGSPVPQPAPGTILAGRFEVVRPHGGGSLLGRDTATLANVVITAVDAGLVSAAAAEEIARLVAELPGLPRLAAPIHAGRDGHWFVLVAPLLHGVPLAERLVHGNLRPAAALAVARDVLRALAACHGRGLHHLAVSPATVMVNPDGPVRSASLVGFGAAVLRDCLAGESGSGDVRYAAPERAGVLDRPVDHRADLYSLGLILHECLTGRPPYAAATDGELLRRRLTDRPPSIRPDHPDVPAALEDEIVRMLAVDPAARPADAAEILAARTAAAGDPSSATATATANGLPAARRPPAAGLVGRDVELGQLVALVTAAAAGRGAAVLLEGPRGSGKTCLLDELCRRAAAGGALVMRGRALDFPRAPAAALDGVVDAILGRARAGAATPAPGTGPAAGDQAPWIERLRAAAGHPAGRGAPAGHGAPAGDGARSIATLLPRLAPVLAAAPAPPPRGGPALPLRWAGAPALARLLAAAGAPDAPAVIVLDDCHWADAAVLDLIAAWSAAAPADADAPRHAVLIAAFRPGGLAGKHPLRQLAAVGRIALAPLADPDLAGLAAATEPAAVQRLVVAAAHGNAARAELAAGWLRDAGRPAPASLPPPEDLAARRIDQLPDDVRKLLTAGALLGRVFPRDLAAAMLGRGDTWTELAGADAERRLLLVPAGPDGRRLAFRQDELRERLLSAASESERRRLHGRARDVLVQAGDAVYAAAWHALQSGDPTRAVARAVAAARAATARQTLDVAEHYLREARRHAGAPASEVALELVEDLAAVHLAQGRTDLAEEQLTTAARIVREPAHQALISASLARIGASRGDLDAATPAAEAAIRARGGRLPGASPIAVVVLLLVELAARRPRRRPLPVAPAVADPADLALAAPVARAANLAQAAAAAAEYVLLATCYAGAGRRLAAVWAALRAVQLAAPAGPGRPLVEGESALARQLATAGLRRRALAAAARATAAAAAAGHDELTAQALAVEADVLYAAGRLAPAAERYARAAALLGGADDRRAQAAVLGGARCDRRLGRGEAARAAAAGVRRRALAGDAPDVAASAHGLWLASGGPGRATPLPTGDADGGAKLEARGLEALAAGELDAAIDAFTHADAAAPGDREAVASARAWLATARRQAAESAGPSPAATAAARAAVAAARAARSNLPHALREQGRIDALAGHPRRADRRLRRSLRIAERQGAREEAVQTRAALGLGAAALPVAPSSQAAPPPPPQPAASRDERLATLLVGGREISSALSPAAIHTAVRDVALPLLQGERAIVVHLSGAVVSGYEPACAESLARVCRALALRAAAQRRTVAVAAGETGETGLDPATLLRTGVRAAICAPIVVGDAVVACLYVDRSEHPGAFGGDELRLCEFVAGMAATALETAAGFAHVESLSRSLEQRVQERTAQLADSNRQLDLSLQRLTEAFERERASAAELKHQAFHDSLTDLANRALFVDRVEHALEVARRAGHEVAVLFVDLDDFKTVNDSLGHPAGDELLVAVALRLREVLRRADTAARLGGDEFGILLEGVDRSGAARAAERILEALDLPFKLAAKEVFVHASIGIALRGSEEISVDSLLRNADVAMYIAKTGGKHAFEVFEQRMHDEIVRRLELKDDLHRGLELRQFVVHYQPLVDIATNCVHGLEALIRWQHPVHGMVSPLDFVPLAEETGLIRAIGDWVLRTACEATRGWQLEPGHEGERLTIGVNLSARELHEPGLVDCVAAALAGSGLAPADLTLEITESVLMTDTEAAIARLRELKALGVRLAIDDFGTGYSSLSYLKHLPVDIVKIDKEFVDDIAHGPQEAALAGAILALSETLHLTTVAEGIEDPDQLRALRRLGCHLGQGYLFSKPMPAAETGALLRGDRHFAVGGEPGLRLVRAV